MTHLREESDGALINIRILCVKYVYLLLLKGIFTNIKMKRQISVKEIQES